MNFSSAKSTYIYPYRSENNFYYISNRCTFANRVGNKLLSFLKRETSRVILSNWYICNNSKYAAFELFNAQTPITVSSAYFIIMTSMVLEKRRTWMYALFSIIPFYLVYLHISSFGLQKIALYMNCKIEKSKHFSNKAIILMEGKTLSSALFKGFFLNILH